MPYIKVQVFLPFNLWPQADKGRQNGIFKTTISKGFRGWRYTSSGSETTNCTVVLCCEAGFRVKQTKARSE